MIDMISKILTNVLTALYQPFWFSLLSAVLLMVLYLYAKEKSGDSSYFDENKESSGNCVGEEDRSQNNQENKNLWTGLKTIARIWKHSFLTSKTFRRLFYLSFYTVMILFRTLLNRNMWANPLSDVMGGWTLTDSNGELSTEPIENLMLFIPFAVLMLWARESRDKVMESQDTAVESRQRAVGDKGMISTVWSSTKVVFLFSLSIEFLQLFLRLGTWQVSDIVYNTVGGMIGGLVYWIGWRVKEGGRA